jgi:hypothetical protein
LIVSKAMLLSPVPAALKEKEPVGPERAIELVLGISAYAFTLTVPALVLAKSLDTVAGCTLKSLAASAAVFVPFDIITTISSCC